jgi:hypothetical protein
MPFPRAQSASRRVDANSASLTAVVEHDQTVAGITQEQSNRYRCHDGHKRAKKYIENSQNALATSFLVNKEILVACVRATDVRSLNVVILAM